MIVLFTKFSLIFFCINSSVLISTLAVASSRTIIFYLLKIVLARHINYFSPTEKTEFTSVISVSSLFFIFYTT